MIQELVDFQQQLINGDLEVKPGQNERINNAVSVGDYCWQGDLKITIIDKIPENFKLIETTEEDKQLVPGNTKGAKHCLEHLDVEYYIPENWNRSENYDSYLGPCIKFNSENKILHQEHGNITIAKDLMIQCTYQKRWDVELNKIKRQLD